MPFTRKAVPTTFVGAALLAALLGGCAGAPPADEEPTPLFASEEDAYAAAEETYRAYIDALNNVDLQQTSTIEEVLNWLVGDAEAQDRKTLYEFRAEALTVTGETTFGPLEFQEPEVPEGEIVARTCLDVSAVDLLTTDGTSVVPPTRANLQPVEIVFVTASTPTRVAIASSEATKGHDCS